MEEIRPIPGWPGYYAGIFGGIYSTWTRKGIRPGSKERTRQSGSMRKMRPGKGPDGRLNVGLWKNGTKVTMRVHTLILITFVGPRPDGMEACHFPDRNPTNCRLDNLRWDLRSGNRRDQVIHGTSNDGSRNGQAKITESDVVAIRIRNQKGESYAQIALDYPISDRAVSMICRRIRWKKVNP